MLTNLFTLRVERQTIVSPNKRDTLPAAGAHASMRDLSSAAQRLAVEVKRVFACAVLFRTDSHQSAAELREFVLSHFLLVEWHLQCMMGAIRRVLSKALFKGEPNREHIQQDNEIRMATDRFQQHCMELLSVPRFKHPLWMDMITQHRSMTECGNSFIHNFKQIYNAFETPRKKL
jgi:hypothetical protein